MRPLPSHSIMMDSGCWTNCIPPRAPRAGGGHGRGSVLEFRILHRSLWAESAIRTQNRLGSATPHHLPRSTLSTPKPATAHGRLKRPLPESPWRLISKFRRPGHHQRDARAAAAYRSSVPQEWTADRLKFEVRCQRHPADPPLSSSARQGAARGNTGLKTVRKIT